MDTAALAAHSHFSVAPTDAECKRLTVDILRRGVIETGRSANWRVRRLAIMTALALLAEFVAAREGIDSADLALLCARLPLDPAVFVADVLAAWGDDHEPVANIEHAAVFISSANEAHWRAAEAWLARYPQYRLVAQQILAAVH